MMKLFSTCLMLLIWFCFGDDNDLGMIDHVLLIGIDGFGGEWLSRSLDKLEIANIRQLISSGSYTKYGRNVSPTMSAPNWGTILTGLRPIQSGIFSNDWSKDDMNNIGSIRPTSYDYVSSYNLPPFPTIFDILKKYNNSLKTAVSYNWKWFDNLFDENINIDYIYGGDNLFDDDTSSDAMIKFIDNYQPNIMFQYFGSVDNAGHHSVWGSDSYYESVENVDYNIGEIIDALKRNNMLSKTQIILTADHGGNDKKPGIFGHGQNDNINMYIPIIFYGKCIKQNNGLSNKQQNILIENSDIAPMILNTFNFNINELPFIKGKIYNDIYIENCNTDFIPPSTPSPISTRIDIIGDSLISDEQEFGEWSEWIYCNNNQYAIGFELDIEPNQGIEDDTSANAFRLICDDGNIIAANNNGLWGQINIAQCSSNNEFIKGFRTKIESKQGLSDDTALNAVEAICSDNTLISINYNGWGNWGTDNLSECPNNNNNNSFVCGFRQKVENNQGTKDDTALNAIQLKCCSKEN